MKKNILFFLTSMLAIFFVACNDTATTDNKMAANDSTMSDSKNVEAHIRAEASKFEEEIRRGDTAAMAAHYGSDAIVMPPNSEEVKGNDIAGLWGSVIRMGVKDIKVNITDITGGGDIYVETGTYEMFDANKKSMDRGKYLVVWKKDNGNWKIYRDIGNSSMPAPGSK